MTVTPDERLALYLDGEMDAAAVAAFEAEMARDPALAETVAAWRTNDRRIATALGPIADAPLPADLVAMLSAAPDRAADPIPAANDNPVWWRRFAVPLGGAVAAGLVAVFLAGPLAGPGREGTLDYALETGRSLQAVQLADGRTVTPTMTVRAADGRFCREYRISDMVGLACRSAGKWSVEAQGKGAGPAGQDTIMTAGGADTAALEGAYARLGASDPLGADEENALISGKWATR